MKQNEILVLGGGIGGIAAASILSEGLGEKTRITLIDRKEKFQFPPSYPWLMAGKREPNQVQRDLGVLKKKGINVIRDEIIAIDPKGKRIKESLQKVYEIAKEFDGHGSRGDVDHLYERLTFLLDTGYEHIRTRKFVDNLLRRKKEWLFRFVIDPEVEPTNNRAERALRPSVIYRKVSGGTRIVSWN